MLWRGIAQQRSHKKAESPTLSQQQHLTPPLPPSRVSFPSKKATATFDPLTVVALVEDDELVPVQLRHQGEQHLVDADGRPGGQCVALAVGAGVKLAGGARRPLPVPLDEEVRDVHGVR